VLAYISGKVALILGDTLLIELPTGLGFSVNVPHRVAATAAVGGNISLFTSLIVREDSLTLFGFSQASDREVFDLLQTVSGIGPKVAASALGVMSANDLLSAISGEAVAALERVPGLGKKGAARIIIDLKAKATELLGASGDSGDMANAISIRNGAKWESDLLAALVGLGYAAKAAEAMLQDLIEIEGDLIAGKSLPQLLKMTLALRGGGR
jgi:Holliday junction DNA helicase RuvA